MSAGIDELSGSERSKSFAGASSKLTGPSTGGLILPHSMKPPEDKPTLTCENIVVAPRGIMEVQSKKIINLVPTSEIDRLTLKFGRSSLHPVLAIITGGTLSLVGVFGVAALIMAPREYSVELALVLLGMIGGFMLAEALKTRFFLDVEQKKGFCRLVFSKHAELKDIREFCEQVKTVYRYKIADESVPAGK